MTLRLLDFMITPESVQQRMESIDLSNKKLGVASAIIIASCIKDNGFLKELRCGIRLHHTSHSIGQCPDDTWFTPLLTASPTTRSRGGPRPSPLCCERNPRAFRPWTRRAGLASMAWS